MQKTWEKEEPHSNEKRREETKTVYNIVVTFHLNSRIFTEYIVPEQCNMYSMSES